MLVQMEDSSFLKESENKQTDGHHTPELHVFRDVRAERRTQNRGRR